MGPPLSAQRGFFGTSAVRRPVGLATGRPTGHIRRVDRDLAARTTASILRVGAPAAPTAQMRAVVPDSAARTPGTGRRPAVDPAALLIFRCHPQKANPLKPVSFMIMTQPEGSARFERRCFAMSLPLHDRIAGSVVRDDGPHQGFRASGVEPRFWFRR